MNNFRILIVDDEPDIRTIVKTVLSTKYEVIEAENGLEALEKIERAEPDFAVLDVMMPLMDGFDTCVAIRNHNRFSTMGVYFLTAKTDKEGIKKGYALGANLYLQKPFDPFRLLQNIEMYFSDNNIKPRPKKYTIDQLKMMESQPVSASTMRSGETLLRPGFMVNKTNMAVSNAPKDSLKPPAFQTGKPRILVSSTDTDYLLNTHSALKHEYEVIIEFQAMNTIESIINYQPEILIMDVIIEGLDTYKLSELIKKNKNLSYLELLFVTSKNYEINLNSFQHISKNPILDKHCKTLELLQTLSTICYKPTFQVLAKMMRYQEIPQDNVSKIREKIEEERKKREREYFKTKHITLKTIFEDMKRGKPADKE